ncbi:MAG: ribosome silencing factor [Anaerohalosphaeraceae bacterium]|nr:ribosome silencing factor [Anaerohalosphaeraceae bacterium]
MAKKQTDTDIDAKELAIVAAKIAIERHSLDVVLLDLKGKSPATDYYLIATGTSDRQTRTVADEITKMAKDNRWKLFGRAGYDKGQWILLDFVDVVVHLLDEEYRDYYDLELIWGDAKKVELEA